MWVRVPISQHTLIKTTFIYLLLLLLLLLFYCYFFIGALHASETKCQIGLKLHDRTLLQQLSRVKKKREALLFLFSNDSSNSNVHRVC